MEIELPDGTVLEAPDDADPSAVAKNYLAKQAATPGQATAKSDGLLGSYYGATLEPALALGSSMVAAPIAGIAGIGQGLKNLVSPGMPAGNRTQAMQEAMTYQPRTQIGQAMTGAAAYPFEKLAQFGDYVGSGLAQSADPNANIVRRPERANIPRRMEGSPLAGAVANTVIQSFPALLARRVGGNAGARPSPVLPPATTGEGTAASETASAARRGAGLAKVSEAAPTKEALKEAATAAYKRAEEAGAIISQDALTRAQQRIASALENDRLDSTLHPDTTAALKRFVNEKGPVTLEKLETLRRIAKDAEGAQRPSDAKLAGDLVDSIDEFAEGLTQKDFVSGTPEAVAANKAARNYWSRARKAEELDYLMERAQNNAGANFTQSGLENALRQQFKSLANNQRRMRLFTAEEQAAIRRVARGTPGENAIRLLGKMAPTGPVSTAISTGLGYLLGGPVGAAAVPIVGTASRIGATRMTMRNAARANALVRRGPLPVPEPQSSVLLVE